MFYCLPGFFKMNKTFNLKLSNKFFNKKNYMTKNFLFGVRLYDLKQKNYFIKSKELFSVLNSVSLNVSVPIHLSSNFWIILNSMKIISFLVYQKGNLTKLKNSKKKWLRENSSILSYWVTKKKNFFFLTDILVSFLPYLKISKNNFITDFLSDTEGNFFFTIKDLSFFSNLLDETFLNWDKFFNINFIIKNNLKLFFFYWTCFNWIIWSSIGLVCWWGHGSWFNYSNIKIRNYSSAFKKKLWKVTIN